EIDRLNVARRVSLHLCGGTNFFDFPVFNQYVRGREHIAGARVEQAGSFYQSCRRRRFGRQLCSSKYSDCVRKDSAYGHVFVSDDLTQETFYIWANKGHQLQKAASVKGWLFTTLHREFLKSCRRRNRFSNESIDEGAEGLPNVPADCAERVDSRTLLRVLGEI